MRTRSFIGGLGVLLAVLPMLVACGDDTESLEQDLAAVTSERDALVAEGERHQAAAANEAAFIEAFMAEDVDAVMATFADDAVFIDETFGDYIVGIDDLRSFYELVFSISDPETTEVLDSYVSADGTRATSVWQWRGMSDFDNAFDLPSVFVHEYRNDLIGTETVYYAARDAYDQLVAP